ncbi:MAG: hypothetical protein LUG46_01325, partial [Erysipelotrichaceae bacterium]|nr:hypothetical protein [Erysipelotrichaceae bacterium]
YNGVYSDLLSTIHIRHVYQDSLYSVDYHDNDEQSYIIEYNMLTNEDIYHPINDNEIKLDLLDETWMTSYVEDNIGYVVLYNLDFSERSIVLEVEIKDGDVINWADI